MSAVGSLSCPLIERANFQLVRQIAEVNTAPNGGLIFVSALPPPHPAKPHKSLHGLKHGGVFRPLQGVRVSRKEMRKAVAGFAGDQPNAMLALSAEERFFLSVLTEVAHIRGYNRSDSQCSIVLLMEYFRVII